LPGNGIISPTGITLLWIISIIRYLLVEKPIYIFLKKRLRKN